MLRKAIFAAAAMAVIGNSAYAQESTEPITVAMSGGYFPFTFVRQGELQGFEVDLMNAIGEELAREIEFENHVVFRSDRRTRG